MSSPGSCLVALALSWSLAVPVAASAADEELHRQYGFDGLLISKFDDGIFGLRAADVNGDHRGDLLLVNNTRARIEILRQRAPDEPLDVFDPSKINELADETYFKRESYALEERVTAVAVADLDADGLPDLLSTGDSQRLTIAYRDAHGDYGRRLRLQLPDPSTRPTAIQTGDLDADGRIDVVVLGKRKTCLFVQQSDGGFGEPVQLPNTSADPTEFALVDVNDDGRLDLVFVEYESEWPFRVRLGRGGTAFGPELRSRFTKIRSFAYGDVDGDGRLEIGAVRRRSGRFSLLRFGAGGDGGDGFTALSSLRRLPYPELADAGKREQVLVDLDGDDRVDLVVAEPSAARLLVYRGGDAGQFGDAQTFPAMLGVRGPRAADLDGDGRPEIVVAAPDESAVGVSTVDDQGRLGFPRALAVPGEDLLAFDVADQDGDGVPEIWVLVAAGKSRSRKHTLARLGANGEERREVEVDLASDPNDLALIDLDGDGRLDVLLFVPGKQPEVMLADGSGFTPLNVDDVPGLGLLKGVSRAQVALADMDGDGVRELVVPGPNFARAFLLERTPDGSGYRSRVVGQFNLDDPSAKVTAAGVADVDGDGRAEVLLVEESTSTLFVLAQREGGTQTVARVALGGLAPKGLITADVDGDGAVDIVLPAAELCGLVVSGQAGAAFEQVHEFELPVKDTSLDRVAFGDLNNDGEADAVFTETRRHLVALAALRADEIAYALKFPVFEERLFDSGRGGREPREILVADVTGDGLDDIAIIVHDRVLVYPQES